MIITSAEFITSAVKPVQYPPPDFPEIAFSGKSNVGKSSLINTLTNRKHLVKTSRTPGRTQLINFFLINKALTLVDLPGFGYAKVPDAVKKTWGPMIETYLTHRKNLKGMVHLFDIRRTPGPEEHHLIDWLKEKGLPCVWILTKADKFSNTQQKNRRDTIGKSLSISPETLILFSAKTRLGREAVWEAISALCSGKPVSLLEPRADADSTGQLEGMN